MPRNGVTTKPLPWERGTGEGWYMPRNEASTKPLSLRGWDEGPDLPRRPFTSWPVPGRRLAPGGRP